MSLKLHNLEVDLIDLTNTLFNTQNTVNLDLNYRYKHFMFDYSIPNSDYFLRIAGETNKQHSRQYFKKKWLKDEFIYNPNLIDDEYINIADVTKKVEINGETRRLINKHDIIEEVNHVLSSQVYTSGALTVVVYNPEIRVWVCRKQDNKLLAKAHQYIDYYKLDELYNMIDSYKQSLLNKEAKQYETFIENIYEEIKENQNK